MFGEDDFLTEFVYKQKITGGNRQRWFSCFLFGCMLLFFSGGFVFFPNPFFLYRDYIGNLKLLP